MNKLTSLAAASALLLLTAVPTFAATSTGGDSTTTLTGGALAITGATPGDFSGNLTAGSQNLYSTLAGYNATDLTGTGAGWHLTIQAIQFATAGATHTFPTGSLFMAAPGVNCNANTSPCSGTAAKPAVSITGEANALDSGSAVALSTAALNTGMGSYDYTPADFAGQTGSQLKLVVPAGSYAGSYTSTLTVSIVTAPAV